jgi:hypothetical protein
MHTIINIKIKNSMKILSNALLAVIMTAFVFTSCKNDPTANNADIAKLSDVSKKALDESSKKACTCLKDNGKDLKAFLDEVNPKLAEAEKSENPMEIIMDIQGSGDKIKNFSECLSKANPKDDEASNKALEEDINKIMGENSEIEAKSKKMLEMMNAYLTKNCPDEQKVFADFNGLGEKMQTIFTKAREAKKAEKEAQESEESTEEKKEDK